MIVFHISSLALIISCKFLYGLLPPISCLVSLFVIVVCYDCCLFFVLEIKNDSWHADMCDNCLPCLCCTCQHCLYYFTSKKNQSFLINCCPFWSNLNCFGSSNLRSQYAVLWVSYYYDCHTIINPMFNFIHIHEFDPITSSF